MMNNRHEFQLAAKSFRAGRISLQQFVELVFDDGNESNQNQSSSGGDPFQHPFFEAAERCEPTSDAANSPKPTTSQTTALPLLPDRSREAHKGDLGRVLLIGGSLGMAGAISLSGLAALRAGSGLVKVAVPAAIQETVASFTPCYMTIANDDEHGMFSNQALDALQQAAAWADVIAIGPGLGRGTVQQTLLAHLFAETKQSLVIDADGLNALADSKTDLSRHSGPRILTPHPGEFNRLLGTTIDDRPLLERRAIEFAQSNQLIVVLKGHHTLITDGQQVDWNQTGNPGMATAGSGDVLTGIVASFVGQGLSPYAAARLAVHVHGLAGDLAANVVGQTSLISTDLLEFLSLAIKQMSAGEKIMIGFGG